MELFLMVLCVSMLCLALTVVAFSSATRGLRDQESAALPAVDAPALAAPRFFADGFVVAPGAPTMRRPMVPADALLLQLERHIRLEHAAAEAFLEFPTPQSLHSRTTSPLVH